MKPLETRPTQSRVSVTRQPKRHFVLVLALGSCIAASALSTIAIAQDFDREDGPIASTAEGPVRGFVKNGVYEFLGIPYAAAPVGALRWMPPQPVTPWHEPLKATRFANTCPQVSELGAFASPASVTEDCLYLNVFTSNLSGRNPILVWIHGGGNFDGESNDYDGSKLATGGPAGSPTVVVTLNYRLGLFGFLAHPSLDSDGHPFGNYGILDQQAVLHWVQRNAAAFGGDPTRVAIGGQSGGAFDVGAHLVSPLSAGLFNRAIEQSGPFSASYYYPPLSVALTSGIAFANAAGCSGDDASTAACLRALSAARILQLQGTANANGPNVTIGVIVDGTVIPIAPENAYATGQFNKMPIMGGNTLNERTFINGIAEYFSGPPQVPMTAADYAANVTNSYAAAAAAVLADYPLANYASPQLAWSAVVTDAENACQNRHVVHLRAKWVPVYQYEFNYTEAPYYYPYMPGFVPLAAHTIDIQFLFPGFQGGILGVNVDQASGRPRELNMEEIRLSDQLVAAWTNFAKSGNPNGSGNSPWPRFTGQTGAPAILSQNTAGSSTLTDEEFAKEHHCAFWSSILSYDR
jgi:para-nitrobenzyl esterase